MSVSISRQSSKSYSARSMSSSSSSSALGLGRGMQQRARGSQAFLVSTGGSLIKGRAPSVYGGAGGYGTRISQSTFSSGSLDSYGENAMITNEKGTMQNLNDRLASYLEKVRFLESSNRKLELQIKEFYEKRAPTVSRDLVGYFATIADLRAQIMKRYSDNQRIVLQIDNAQLAADDFKMKYEMELNLHMMVESDVMRLRGVRDNLTLGISDMELQIESLKEELVYMKSSHDEELHRMRIQQTGDINVEVDSPQSVNMELVLQEMREQYESVVVKNNQELEKWFQTKVDNLQVQILSSSTESNTFYTELSELKRTYQSLEISRDSVQAEIQCLQKNMEEVNSRYSVQLSQLQMTINTMEIELQQLRVSIEQQQVEYQMLLDIKMRLELEIAEYRRLLDGELHERKIIEKKAVVISKVVVVEEQKPHIERRVRTIVEEIVDGKVVSSSVDTQVEDIQ
ncbi:keratin 99 [Cottoperca gobio]|uniref:Keratin 99 n=1 Tax=Cottoperca gobio TaxID=56716 RepID=A0A6J2Q8W8_COTGO|nr:keratin, type I cytoskeletal 19-like [Cottoperca gobio]